MILFGHHAGTAYNQIGKQKRVEEPMGLKVYNSLTREREEFVPLNPPRVTIYVCGPTVYGHSHLGHAKSYVSFDAIVRWMRFSGYDVNYVQNITDVGHLTDDADEGEDKIIAEARRRGLHPMAVVETYMTSYLADMDALNLLRPDIMPRATGHIPEQIEQIRILIEKGSAYEVNGSVYFDVHSFPDYGRLSGRVVAEMEAGARVAVNQEKKHAADFALWKRADESHVMRWPSPWGSGYPGWHIECSVMSQKYLGETFDIHGGGLENKFPHHECEIAQAVCATGKPFARYWLHNNMCTLNGQKMGKSLGNAISLRQVFRDGHDLLDQTFDPVVVRHFILTSHYRQPLDFSNDALRAAESGTRKLRDAARALSDAARSEPQSEPQSEPESDPQSEPESEPEAQARVSRDIQGNASAEATAPPPLLAIATRAPTDSIRTALSDIATRFTDAMNEDFNTAAAIAVAFDLAKQSGDWITAGLEPLDLQPADRMMHAMTQDVLGLRWPEEDPGSAAQQDCLIAILADLRQQARKNKNFDQADQIRNRLAELGIELRDTPDGPAW